MTTMFNQRQLTKLLASSLCCAFALAGTVEIANGQSSARIVSTSIQEPADQEPDEEQDEVSKRPVPDSSPSPGLVTKERVDSINDRISMIKKMMEREREREKAAKQKAIDDLVEQAKPQPVQEPAPHDKDLTEKKELETPAEDTTVISGTPVVAQQSIHSSLPTACFERAT